MSLNRLTTRNSLASYAVGFMVTVIVLFLAVMVAGAFASSVAAPAEAPELEWAEQSDHDPDDTTIELTQYDSVTEIAGVYHDEGERESLEYEYDEETQTIDYDAVDGMEEGDTVTVEYYFEPEEGDLHQYQESWEHSDGQTEYEPEYPVDELHTAQIIETGEEITSATVTEDGTVIEYDADEDGIEPGDELGIDYTGEYDGSDEEASGFAGTIQQITGYVESAFMILGVTVLVIPAIAVVLLLRRSGLSEQLRGGR